MKLLGILVKSGQKVRIIVRIITILIGAFISAMVFSLAAGLILLHQKEFKLPSWASDPILRRIDDSLGNVNFQNSELSVSLDAKWRPMLTFDSTVLSDLEGRGLLSLRQLDAVFSLQRAIVGKLQVTELALDGLLVSVFKNTDGSVAARFGGGEENAEGAILPADIKFQLDRLFMEPWLAEFKTFEIQNITLNYVDRLANRNWTIDGARFFLTKSGDTLIARSDLALLTGGADVAVLEANFEGQIGQQDARFGLKFSELPSDILATQSSAFVWLSALKTSISGALRGSLDASGALGPLYATFNIANGILQPSAKSKPLSFDMLRTYFTYEPKAQTLKFDNLSLQSSDLSLTAEGNAFIEQSENKGVSLIGQFRLNDIKANPQNTYQTDIILDFATVDFRFLVDPFEVQLKQLYVRDEARAIDARMSAVVSIDRHGWTVSMDSEIDQISSASLLEYWPDFFKPKPRKWVQKNILKAEFSKVMFSLRYDNENRITSDTKLVFKDMTFRALSEFPLIKNANGIYSNYNHRLVASFQNAVTTAENGGTVDLSNSQFVIPDTKVLPSPAQLTIVGEGRLKTVLELLNTAPLSILDRASQKTDIAYGDARFEANITFPIKSQLTASDISASATGEILDFATNNLFGGHYFSGKRASVELTPETLILRGKGDYKDVKLDTELEFDFQTGASSVLAGLDIDQQLLDSFSIPIQNDVLSGTAPSSLRIVLPKDDTATFSLQSDLVGATLKLDQFNWQKPKDAVSNLLVIGHFDDRLVVDSFLVEGAGLKLSGHPQKSQDGSRTSFIFKKFSIDQHINIAGSVNADGSLKVSKGYFDARPYLVPSNKPKTKSQKKFAASIALDRLQVTNELLLRNFVGDLTIGQSLSGKFSANMGPRAKLNGQFQPVSGQTRVIMRSKQAGAVLSEFGAVKNAVGGELLLTLKPAITDRATDGYLKVDNVKIQGVPILAEILNAISIVGLIDLLSGPGISLHEIESDFRITKDQLILKRASAFGPSMGITLDGYYDLRSKTFDMQGVISPIYLINSVGSVLSRKGEGLLGFNFVLKGKVDNFDLRVNPLSVFTPAIFRDIFRRPPPVYEE